MENNGSDLFVIILLGFFLMLLMVSFIVIMVIYHRQRQLENRQKVATMEAKFENTILNVEKEIREETLSYVGRELHDNIGQMLSLAKINLGSSRPNGISESKSIINEVIKEVRSLSKSLNLDWVESISLEDYIKKELEKLRHAEFCEVEWVQEGAELQLAKDKKLILIRVFQEILNNAIKHAAPDLISVGVFNKDGKARIEIKDDGEGFDLTEQSEGSGMSNLKKRMETLGGTIEIQSIPEKGTFIKLNLPEQN
ncbi:sensor histidine kinase [Arthrospiribacter ruber]|uniref:histidine kinase n=1 Tax=Arthrospiribacter ruber TaxID=2487934 RepID=A0A951MDQ9_9BACT|nr:ATP-binding protein [Arthrospiribacter ruber]MBW3469239.1 histidine kinase [Arthrospiribacter ruber]